ncbi:FAD-dependent monooxygenase [Xanthobacter dioxanivorans]|uniref:FAD-dependent monooxygenase n=2 Tax=Xanthobacter dioxanivorans TaxID=2528964 RepID=A0A974SL36_9HYPH|nr:FAD-dependent monooxygenase [Xanthobacter dioxanivorans]
MPAFSGEGFDVDCAVAVLVVGAGPTGLLLAAELHRRGVDCLLIDAHERPLDWDRATVVHPRSIEIFESLGIVEPLLAAGVRQRRARLHSNGSALGDIDLALCGSRYAFNLGVSEEVTEAILTDYLIRQGGTVTRSTRLVGLEERADGVLATMEREGAEIQVLAQWVAGCDGHRSTVRTLAGIAQDGHDIAEPWAVFDATVGGFSESYEANYAYLDEIPVILTALPDRRWRVYLRPSTEDSDLVADASATIARYLPSSRFEDVANPTRFQCHTKVAQRYRAGRLLLAGDAAHTCSPVQGHGMNSGLQDAYNLSWKLALVCQGHCPDTLLDSYEAERRPVAQMVTTSGDEADSAQMLKDPSERRARDAAIRAVFANPATRHQEAVAEAELNIDYGGSPIVMGDRHHALAPGQRLPDRIEVRAADGGVLTLDAFTNRPGHTALLIGGASTTHDELADVHRAIQSRAGVPVVEAAFTLTAQPEQGQGQGHGRLEPDAADRLGVGAMTLLVVRPDGHVGLRADAGHAEALAAYGALLGTRET